MPQHRPSRWRSRRCPHSYYLRCSRRHCLRLLVALVLAALAVPLPASGARADEIRDSQWHLGYLDLGAAHQVTRGEGVTVALVDSGVDATHPDLRDVLLPGVDLVDPDNENAWTPDEHGTLVAGVLGGQGHGSGNGDGVLGVAPGARLLPIRATGGEDDEQAQPTTHLVADAVTEAVQRGASVISISLGSEHSEVDERAIAAARRSDVVVVAAAGNLPEAEGVTFPAALPTVTAVGGVDRDRNRADFSVTGPEVALSAPGEEIVTTFPGGEYAVAEGTSFAAPIVAGTAALVRARYPELSAGEVVHRLVATATDAGPAGRDDQYGHGVVDPLAALTAEVGPAPPPADEPDQTRRDQWHLPALDLATAHGTTRGEGVTVAVVGSGVDGTHPDLHHNTLPGVDLAQPDNDDAWTPGASGTAAAGIIAAHGNRLHDHQPGNRGALGLAPAATILPVRVTGAGTELTDREAVELAADGIEWAAANGADVICYAAGRASRDLFTEAVAAAQAADAVLVAGAGDASGASSIWFPAADPAVVAAAGVDADGNPAEGSLSGPEVTLAAPAVDIVTTAPDHRYLEDSGTTVAAAMIAGAAALVRSQDPSRPADEVVHRLVATATDAGPAGRDDQYGHGVLDLVAALTADVPPPSPTPGAGAGPTTPDRGAGPPPPGSDPGPLAAVVAAGAVAIATVGTAVLVTARVRQRRSRAARSAADDDPAAPVSEPGVR